MVELTQLYSYCCDDQCLGIPINNNISMRPTSLPRQIELFFGHLYLVAQTITMIPGHENSACACWGV